MAAACHVCAAVLVHVARSGQLEAVLDERSFSYSLRHKVAIKLDFSKIPRKGLIQGNFHVIYKSCSTVKIAYIAVHNAGKSLTNFCNNFESH